MHYIQWQYFVSNVSLKGIHKVKGMQISVYSGLPCSQTQITELDQIVKGLNIWKFDSHNFPARNGFIQDGMYKDRVLQNNSFHNLTVRRAWECCSQTFSGS